MRFTVEEAIAYANNNSLHDWVVSFLMEDGNNPDLARGIQLQRDNITLLSPRLYPVRSMEHYFGEPGDPRYNKPFGWVDLMCQSLDKGWIPAPFILAPKETVWLSSEMVRNSRYTILDGNHRQEALIRKAYAEYWAINCIGLKLH